MKTRKLIELERKRGEIINDARSILADFDNATTDDEIRKLEKKHDEAMRAFDSIQLDIAEEEVEAKAEDDARGKRPNSENREAPAGGEYSYSGNRAKWQTLNGKEVRCLEPSQKFATERHDGIGIGQTMRAMITGPRNDDEKRALSEGSDAAGGYTVPSPLAQEFIDKLRAASVLNRAGARTIDMTTETLAIAKLASDPQAAWTAENAAVTESDPTFARVDLEAKKLIGITRLSRELAEDSTNVNEMLENAIVQAVSQQFDYAGLYGSGSSNEPTGIVNQAGINTATMGTNGAAPANYDKFIDAIYENQLDNAADPTAMIWHPRTGVTLAKLKDGDNNPMSVPEMVAKVPKLSTTAMPIDETKGTNSDASSVITGDFTQMLIGLRSNLRIKMLDQTYAANDQVAFMFGLRGDFALAQPTAFCRLDGVRA
jgi:HK97 family phage major capsid protein